MQPQQPTRSKRKLFTTAAIISLLLITLAACASSNSTNNSTAKPTNSTTQQATNPPAQPVLTAQSAQPTQPPQPTQITVSTITGYGALLTDWNNSHTQDPNYATNAVYDPIPGLGIDSSYTDKYYSVQTASGRVTNYEMRLPNGQGLTASQQEVMQEFPTDTSILWQHTIKGQCSQMEVQSHTLGTILGSPNFGDPKGHIFIEFQTDTLSTESLPNYYNPSNVNLAILTLLDYDTASDAGGC
jgi:hypothetical protein